MPTSKKGNKLVPPKKAAPGKKKASGAVSTSTTGKTNSAARKSSAASIAKATAGKNKSVGKAAKNSAGKAKGDDLKTAPTKANATAANVIATLSKARTTGAKVKQAGSGVKVKSTEPKAGFTESKAESAESKAESVRAKSKSAAAKSKFAGAKSKLAGAKSKSAGAKSKLAGAKSKSAGANIRSSEERAATRAIRPKTEKLAVIRPSGQREDNFFELVHQVARQIPYGRVTSYGAIAAVLGTRMSARMVGWAMNACHLATEPVPAHRVVNSQGLLTGRHHFNPPEKMQELLEQEGTKVVDSKVVDFKTRFWNPIEEL